MPSDEKTTHEIEALGGIRAGNGTALEVIAGAAKHWQDTAKSAEALLEHTAKRSWRDGYLAGTIVAVIAALTSLGIHQWLLK